MVVLDCELSALKLGWQIPPCQEIHSVSSRRDNQMRYPAACAWPAMGDRHHNRPHYGSRYNDGDESGDRQRQLLMYNGDRITPVMVPGPAANRITGVTDRNLAAPSFDRC